MIERRLRILILTFLWAALVEDTFLFLMAWTAPDLWFRVFHGTLPARLEVAFLRRSAGQWAAFALAQAITLWRRKKDPVSNFAIRVRLKRLVWKRFVLTEDILQERLDSVRQKPQHY